MYSHNLLVLDIEPVSWKNCALQFFVNNVVSGDRADKVETINFNVYNTTHIFIELKQPQ